MNIRVVSRNFFAVLVKEFVKRENASDECKELIVRFRQALGIDPEDYVKIMKTVAMMKYNKTSDSVPGDLDIFKKAVNKTFVEKALPRKYQDIIKAVAEILMISREERVKVLRSLNFRSATSKEEKKGKVGYNLHDFIFVQSLVPEVLIKVRSQSRESGFLGKFVKDTADICLYYYSEQGQPFIALGDSVGKRFCFRHKVTDEQSEDIKSVFSRELLDAYLIKLIRGKKTYTVYRSGRIDVTGNHYKGLVMCRDDEKYTKGIEYIYKAAEENENIYGVNFLLGRYYLGKGDLPSATKYLYREERHFPANMNVLLPLSELFQKRGKAGKSREYVSKAVKSDPFKLQSILYDLRSKCQDIENNLDRIFSLLLLGTVLYPTAGEYLEILLEIKKKLSMPELEILLLKENEAKIEPIKKFMIIRDLFLSGYYGMAIILCQNYIDEYMELLQQDLVFRLSIRDFLFFQFKNMPDKSSVGALEMYYNKL